jgi:uncharacterized protein (TIGR03435 family)
MSTRLSKLRPILLLAVATAAAWAQPKFEVASIKPSSPDATAQNSRFNLRGDRLDITAATVGGILDWLNGFQLFRVVGGPPWTRTDRYDIVAKADQPIPQDALKPVVMALLAERFQLQSHTETRDIPGFTIRALKSQAALKPATPDEKYSQRMTNGDVVFTAAPMSSLTNFLSQVWTAPVEDQTKLEGAYDFTLAVSQVERHPGEKGGDWVRSAMEETGFRVEARKIPLEVTVVDRCERPSEN